MDIPAETLEKLQQYRKLLLKWQESINLIGPSTVDSAWQRHFLDSVQLLNYLPDDIESLADIGTGAGFPGMVLAMLKPDLTVYLVDSDAKKCEFLKTVSRETNTPVKIVNERIEKTYQKMRVDFVTARALANLQKLMGHMHGYNATRGLFLKGQAYEEEVEMAKRDFDFSYEAFPSAVSEEGVVLSVQIEDPVYQ